MKSKKLPIGILCGVLAVAIALTASLVVLNNSPQRVYRAKITSAQKLISTGDFDNAILELKEAIRQNEDDPEPYLMLADIYVQNSSYSLAVSTLKKGWNKTHSARIKLALSKLGVTIDENGEVVYKLGEEAQDGEKTPSQISLAGTINEALLKRFARFTYSDYGKNYTIDKETPKNRVYTISYVGMDADFSYYNSNKDKNVLEPNGKPYAAKLPSEITVKDLSVIFTGIENGLSFEKLQSMNIYNLRKSHSDEWKCNTVEFDTIDCHIIIEADASGNIVDNTVKNKIIPLAKSGSASSERTLQGRVLNVTTADSVEGVRIRFRAGANAKNGEVVYETECSDGNYTILLSSGEYTAEVTAQGYMTEYFAVYVSETNEVTTLDFALSPTLADGEIRIVLEWDANPYDLDSHLMGRSSDGTLVDIYYVDKVASSGSNKIAELDLDDTDGYGPETTTIYDSNGVYEFKVHHYSGSGTLITSGATVKIYMGNQSEPVRVDVPSNLSDSSGLWWNVCTINNGQLTINEG